MLALLTPKPFRGDVIAAGVVVLVTLVWTLVARFADAWGPGVHVAYCAAAFLLVGTLAVRAPLEGGSPRAYQSVLYVATVALAIVLIAELHDLLDGAGAGSAASAPAPTPAAGESFRAQSELQVETGTPSAWVTAAEAAAVALPAFAFAYARNSAVCTLLGSLAGGVAVLFAAQALWSPDIAGYRWLLLALAAVFGVAAVGQRDRRPRHGVALIDAAGLAVSAIGLTFFSAGLISLGEGTPTDPSGVGWGWELLILAAGFGLIAYSSVDRQPGPAYLGVANLVLFTLITAVAPDGASLLGWPLALAVAAALLLVVGLRPTTPAPPPPDIDAPEPPPLPWR